MNGQKGGANSKGKTQGFWLRVCVKATSYRYEHYFQPSEVPEFSGQKRPSLGDIQEKARASLATSGAFLALSIAVLAALVGSDKFQKTLLDVTGPPRFWKIFSMIPSVALPYFVIWSERYISAASTEQKGEQERKRERGYMYLGLSLCGSLAIFLAVPLILRFVCTSELKLFRLVFPVSGSILIVASVFFLIPSLELYDSASGWRGNDGLHFHLAGLASHLNLIGFPLALVGLSLLLCLFQFWAGCIITCLALIAASALTAIERNLWYMQGGKNSVPSHP